MIIKLDIYMFLLETYYTQALNTAQYIIKNDDIDNTF